MKTFKEFKQNLLEFGDTPRPMSGPKGTADYKEVTPFVQKMEPYSLVAKHKVNVGKEAELAKQAEKKSSNPMKMGDPDSSYAERSGGVVKFPKTPNLLKTVEEPKSASSSDSKPVEAPLPKQTLSTQLPAENKTAPKIGASKPAATKSLPKVKSAIAKPSSKEDPNVGGGIVTAKAYGSKNAGITSTQNVNKSPLDSLKLAKQGSAERSSQLKKLGFKEF